MPGWEGSDRRSYLPPNWPALRQKRFKLDGYQCTAKDANTGLRCTGPAEECDHTGDREDHRIEMLRSLCSWHHGQKSGRQGAIAAARQRARINKKFRRDTEHPGLL